MLSSKPAFSLSSFTFTRVSCLRGGLPNSRRLEVHVGEAGKCLCLVWAEALFTSAGRDQNFAYFFQYLIYLNCGVGEDS